eukprot:752236-Hanusia_phi.AAC.2
MISREEVEKIASTQQDMCPRSGGLVSLEVPELWTVQGNKFDHRVYVLVPSMDPWTIFFHHGHLRFSVFNHTVAHPVFLNNSNHATAVPETDPHVTTPRSGLAHTNHSQDVLKPLSMLRTAAEEEFGEARGQRMWRKMTLSARNAALSAMFSIRHRKWGQSSAWGHLFMAVDVAYDRHGNAFVLDLNSGPSFYPGNQSQGWFAEDRSTMIREATDIIQEIAFRKLVSHQEAKLNPLNLTAMPLKTPKTWEMLFAEGGGWRHEGRNGLIKEGGCVSVSYENVQAPHSKVIEELKVRKRRR